MKIEEEPKCPGCPAKMRWMSHNQRHEFGAIIDEEVLQGLACDNCGKRSVLLKGVMVPRLYTLSTFNQVVEELVF